MPKDSPPALIIGSGLGVLGAARLFGRAGIPTYCYGAPQLEARSRWYRPAPACDIANARPDRLAGYLATCPLDSAVLIPASDAAVDAIATLPQALRNRFPSSVPSIEVAKQLTDKALFGEMMERLGEPCPRTRRIDSPADLAAAPDEEMCGAFLKPTDSAAYATQYGVKGARVTSRQDALQKAAIALADGHRLVLQEYVPTTLNPDGTGPRGDHILIDGFIDAQGQITAMFARRRLRMFPLDFGNTTHMVSIPLAEVPQAAHSLQRIAQHLGCRGIVSGEFKQDPRDGAYKLLEINSRVWWFVEFAGRCGVDLCTMSYRDALGQKIEPIETYKTGAKFVHAYYDFHATKAMLRTGKISALAAARSWFNSQEPWFNWTDPMPAVHDTLKHFKRRAPTKASGRPRLA